MMFYMSHFCTIIFIFHFIPCFVLFFRKQQIGKSIRFHYLIKHSDNDIMGPKKLLGCHMQFIISCLLGYTAFEFTFYFVFSTGFEIIFIFTCMHNDDFFLLILLDAPEDPKLIFPKQWWIHGPTSYLQPRYNFDFVSFQLFWGDGFIFTWLDMYGFMMCWLFVLLVRWNACYLDIYSLFRATLVAPTNLSAWIQSYLRLHHNDWQLQSFSMQSQAN